MNRLILLAMPLMLIACQPERAAASAETSEAAPAVPEAPSTADAATPATAASNATATTDATAASAAAAASPMSEQWVKATVVQTASVLRRFHWNLASASNPAGAPIEALAGRPGQPLSLDFTGGALSVRNACAALAGQIQLTGDVMTIKELAAGEQGCKDAKLKPLDAAVLEHLKGKLTIRFATGKAPKLSLVNEAGATLIFTSTPAANGK